MTYEVTNPAACTVTTKHTIECALIVGASFPSHDAFPDEGGGLR